MKPGGLVKVKGNSGLWKFSGRSVYWVEAHIRGYGRRSASVEGSIHDARARLNQLRELIVAKQPGSLKESFVRCARVLRFYHFHVYRKKARWCMGSGPKMFSFWFRAIGALSPAELRSEDVRAALLKLRGLSPATRNAYLGTLKSAFAFAQEAGKVPANPVLAVKLEKVTDHEPVTINRDALQTFREELPPYIRALFEYKEIVPSRVLELCNLPVTAVNLDEATITLSSDLTKTGRGRLLPIPGSARAWFEYVIREGSAWAFPRVVKTKEGYRFDQLLHNHIADKVSEIRDRHGFDKRYTFRRLRATAISGWLRAGVDIGTVSSTAGASPRTIRKHYDAVDMNAKFAAVEKYEKATKAANCGAVVELFGNSPNVIPFRKVASV